MSISTTVENSNASDYDDNYAGYKDHFQSLSVDDQLAVLGYLFDELGDTVIESPDDNKESDSSSELYQQISDLSEEEQLQFMRNILSGEEGEHTSDYQNLSNTTKVALWYRLGEGMKDGSIVQMPSDYSSDDQASELVNKVGQLSFEQRFIFMRDALFGQ